MDKALKKYLMIGFILIVAGGLPATYFIYTELYRVYSDDPLVWEDAIHALEMKTEAQNPPEDAVLFVGSSSIRFWDTLSEDMAPLPVIQHGFGGAKIYDVVFYAERLITRWNSPKVVIFVGSNDINNNENHHLAPKYIGDQLKSLLDIIFQAKPDTEVFYISITPTRYSWDKWESIKQANRMAKKVCDDYENVYFIETDDIFLNEQGEPNKNLFVIDGLHLNDLGYALWASRIKPYLLPDKLDN